MSLYYSLVLGLLVTEMTLFGLISLPLPSKFRRPLLNTLRIPFHSQRFQIVVKCLMGFILVLFIDSFTRMRKINTELYRFNDSPLGGILSTNQPPPPPSAIGESRSEISSRRFYAQRNLYLCGFTLFLTYVLNRTYALVFELLAVKDNIQITLKNKELNKLDAGDLTEYKKLKEELKEKNKQIENLKKQADALSKDYDTIGKK